MKLLAHHIISPLGFSSAENYEAVIAEKSALREYTSQFGIPEPFFASLLDNDIVDYQFNMISNTTIDYTKMEKIAILSAYGAINESKINSAAADVIFIISTTKGNIELLDDPRGYEKNRVYLWNSANLIAQFFGNPNTPIVVSNACISGCAAQITADRLLKSGNYRYAVVIGAEVLSKFIISGFQSFKALSPQCCKPFDADRCGLNLGEAAASIVYTQNDNTQPLVKNQIYYQAGSICNDANHISGPSRTAEGQYQALENVMQNFDIEKLAFINAHGTATRYNDDMESIAISRRGLQNVPVNSMKAYFGHTLGAAGILEVILSTLALQNHKVLKTLGNENPGTSCAVHIANGNENITQKSAFIKTISGFGGVNAALLFTMNNNN